MEELIKEYLCSIAAINGRIKQLCTVEQRLHGEAYTRCRKEQATLREELCDLEYALHLMSRYLPRGKGGG